MAKVRGPIFSLDAKGSLGDGITYMGSYGGPRVIVRPRHGDAKSGEQLTQRTSFQQATSQWKALSGGSKAYYDTLAKGLAMSGYNFYVKEVLLGNIAVPQWVEGSLDRQIPTWANDCLVYRDAGTTWSILVNESLGVGHGATESYVRQGAGLRWTNITIPKGATITAAYIKVRAVNNYSLNTVNTKIIGNLEANAAVWSNIANYKSRRGTSVGGADDSKRTVAEVLWDGVVAFVDESEYQSPDIKTVIEEIVGQAGWVSGNALALWWDDHDGRGTDAVNVFRGFYGGAPDFLNGVKLHIEYEGWV